MAEVQCAQCGIKGEPTSEWSTCENCDSYYCPACSRSLAEKQELGKFRDVDPVRRATATCPKCGSETAWVL